MKMRILFAGAAVALSLYFAPGVAEAEKQVTIDVQKCKANCEARAKQCALNGNSSVQGCVVLKNICLQDICGFKGAGDAR